MGIPHKKTRPIEVNGKYYRYTIRKSQDHDCPYVVIQEDEIRPGRPLKFYWPKGHSILPSDIASTIKLALTEGWDPSNKVGGVYEFKFNTLES